MSLEKETEIKETTEPATEEEEPESAKQVSPKVATPSAVSPVKAAQKGGATSAKVPPTADVGGASVKKPRKLLSLKYNYSDSDDDETREERKARVVSLH